MGTRKGPVSKGVRPIEQTQPDEVMDVAPIRTGRQTTATTNFGSGRREGHDATAFYDRFTPPEISNSSQVNQPAETNLICCQDARRMEKIPSDSVALVVTSPPYFAGKQYEESLGVNGVPATYFEYLELLHDVFAECKRVLEPGGRVAVNVANLGRRPYRSLSADVTGILEDLGLLLRGEIVWWKGRAAGGSCAWGTFQSPANPVLRDVTERIVVASKGRFDRALTSKQRADRRLPSTSTISRDEFLEATTDLWEIAPESATKVGHPAPFPVELPKRIIELYTYENDVVVDPFMGSGSTAVAALRTRRRFIGFDTDEGYVRAATTRIEQEQSRLDAQESHHPQALLRIEILAVKSSRKEEDPHTRAIREGWQAKDVARLLVESCGFVDIRENVKPRGLGIVLNLVATDRNGNDWAFDLSGAFTSTRSGLRRADTLWKSLGKAGVLHQSDEALPLILLTTDKPSAGTDGHKALRMMCGPSQPVFDVCQLLNADDKERLSSHAAQGRPPIVT